MIRILSFAMAGVHGFPKSPKEVAYGKAAGVYVISYDCLLAGLKELKDEGP